MNPWFQALRRESPRAMFPFVLLAGSATAANALDAPLFSVGDVIGTPFPRWGGRPVSLNGDSVVLSPAITLTNGEEPENYFFSTGDELVLPITPAPGYMITGSDVTYTVAYHSTPYVIQAGDLPDYGPPGTELRYKATFHTGNSTLQFSGDKTDETQTLTEHYGYSQAELKPPPEVALVAPFSEALTFWTGAYFESPLAKTGCIREDKGSGICSIVDVPHDDTITVSMTITPQVAAIPEPQTYALMLAGLGVLAVARRRH